MRLESLGQPFALVHGHILWSRSVIISDERNQVDVTRRSTSYDETRPTRPTALEGASLPTGCDRRRVRGGRSNGHPATTALLRDSGAPRLPGLLFRHPRRLEGAWCRGGARPA